MRLRGGTAGRTSGQPSHDGFLRQTRTILDDLIWSLETARPTGGAARGPPPLHFIILSRDTKFFVDVPLNKSFTVDLPEMMVDLYEVVDSGPPFEDGSIYRLQAGKDELLIEPRASLLFAVVYGGPVERERFRGFHGAVGLVLEAFPELARWQGDSAGLPPHFTQDLKAFLWTGKASRH